MTLKGFNWTETKSQFLLAGFLLLLMPLLAALQYRWLGQLSESEEKQMQVVLRAAATRFGEDFDQEITNAYAAFLPDVVALEVTAAQPLAPAYARAQAALRHPRLIKAVYQSTVNEERQLTLARFDPATSRSEPCAWPVELAELQEEMKGRFARLQYVPRHPPSSAPPPDASRLRTLLKTNPPTLIIPQPGPMNLAARPDFTPSLPLSFVIVLLNQDYITQELLPALTTRHFGAGAQNSYVLTVSSSGSSGAPPRTFFHSTASPLTATNADVSINFFRLQFAELRDRLEQRRRLVPSPLPLVGPPNGRANARRAPPVLRMMPSMGVLVVSEHEHGLWQLHVQHKSGSLATAVARARRRNLILISSILLLLAGSVVLLVRSARRARQLAQQQMDFVAGVSHELRAPITVIDSAAYNLAKGVPRSHEQIQHYGQVIRKQTRQLHEMLEQVLEFAGIQTGRQPYQFQPVELQPLLEEFVQANQPLLAERGFQLHLEIADELPAVQGNAEALRRALQNLLNNAQKYSGASRWIGLQASVDESVQPAQLILAVHDRGLGIPAADLPHIFEPFYRGSEVKAAQIHGNGLGLSLVQNIVQTHGGRLTVHSQVGAGSTFTIRLPLAEQLK